MLVCSIRPRQFVSLEPRRMRAGSFRFRSEVTGGRAGQGSGHLKFPNMFGAHIPATAYTSRDSEPYYTQACSDRDTCILDVQDIAQSRRRRCSVYRHLVSKLNGLFRVCVYALDKGEAKLSQSHRVCVVRVS